MTWGEPLGRTTSLLLSARGEKPVRARKADNETGHLSRGEELPALDYADINAWGMSSWDPDLNSAA